MIIYIYNWKLCCWLFFLNHLECIWYCYVLILYIYICTHVESILIQADHVWLTWWTCNIYIYIYMYIQVYGCWSGRAAIIRIPMKQLNNQDSMESNSFFFVAHFGSAKLHLDVGYSRVRRVTVWLICYHPIKRWSRRRSLNTMEVKCCMLKWLFLLGGGNSHMFLCSPQKLGKMKPFW